MIQINKILLEEKEIEILDKTSIERRRLNVLKNNEMKYISFKEIEDLVEICNCSIDDLIMHK